MATDPLEERKPLKEVDNKLSSEAVDYEAVFHGAGQKRTEFAQETVIGECRNMKRASWIEWVFLVVASLSILAVLGVTIERIVYFEQEFFNLTDNSSGTPQLAECHNFRCTNDYIFAIVVLINIFFCMFYCFDGMLRERPFEMLAYVAGVTVIVVYIIVNYAVQGDEEQYIRIVRLVAVCVLGPLNIVLALLSWWKMGYLVFNLIGSNKSLITAYRFRSLFSTLQFFHLEVLCSLLVLAWGQDGRFLELWEKIIICLLLVYTVCITPVGGVAVLWEVKLLSYLWYGLISPCAFYYIYKLIIVSVQFHTIYSEDFNEEQRDSSIASVDGQYIAIVLLLACVFGIILVAVLIALMTIVMLNFGKGLKDKIRPPFSHYVTQMKCYERLK